jgi:hypothetical protein
MAMLGGVEHGTLAARPGHEPKREGPAIVNKKLKVGRWGSGDPRNTWATVCGREGEWWREEPRETQHMFG